MRWDLLVRREVSLVGYRAVFTVTVSHSMQLALPEVFRHAEEEMCECYKTRSGQGTGRYQGRHAAHVLRHMIVPGLAYQAAIAVLCALIVLLLVLHFSQTTPTPPPDPPDVQHKSGRTTNQSHGSTDERSTVQQHNTWAAYRTVVFGKGSTVKLDTVQVLYSRSFLADSAAELAMDVDSSRCFKFTGMGDRPCAEPSGNRFGGHGPLIYNPRYSRPAGAAAGWNHSDNSWVEVTRFAPYPCMGSSTSTTTRDDRMCEGSVAPWSEHQGHPKQAMHASSLVVRPWGCWFFIAPGSGVYVNIGRSMRFPTRAAAWRMLGNKLGASASERPADSSWYCIRAANPKGCWVSDPP